MNIANRRLRFHTLWLFLTVLGNTACADNQTSWSAEILNWGMSPWHSAPVDLSFLNASEKPAGKHGFVRTVKDKLVFEDGTPARFWGTNVVAYALFGMNRRQDIQLQAKRLSQLGFNLVRIHHHDSSWVRPNIFGSGNEPDTKSLNKDMLGRLDWWIKCLKDEGIYIWLDLEVDREFKPGDGIDGFDELYRDKSRDGLKGFNYVNGSIQQAMQRFNEAYLNHVNPFTGLAYKDDPAIAAVLVTNENDVTYHYANRMLPDKNVPVNSGLYMAQAQAFAEKTGLPKDKVWRGWELGPSKLFLNDLEHRFDVTMSKHLRDLGVKVPIIPTSSWSGALFTLPSLTGGSLIDVHAYGPKGDIARNPLKAPTMVQSIASAQIVDRPLTVSEWNVSPFPVPDRHAMPLFIAGSASFQGWDGLMQYAYSQQPLLDRGRPSNWQSFNDPGLMATLPAAALLYRRQDVQEARTVYVFTPTEAQLFNNEITSGSSVALRTAAEKGKLLIAMPKTKELPWLEQSQIPAGAKVITDLNQSFIDANAQSATSDTGELKRDWEAGIFTIDTPRSQAAMGNLGGKTIKLKDVDIAVSTVNATVAVQSLGEKSIGDADSILISLGAQSNPSGTAFYSEPVIGQLTIRAKKGLKLYPQKGPGPNQPAIEVPYVNGHYQIALNRNLGTYWLVLK